MKQSGFTLIEVMIVAAVLAILTMIALPSYNESIYRAHRSEARSALALASQYLERLRSERGTYQVGGAAPALPSALVVSPRSGTTQYNLSVTAATTTAFTLTAAPTSAMTTDSCGSLTLDQTGLRGYTGTGGTDLKCLTR